MAYFIGLGIVAGVLLLIGFITLVGNAAGSDSKSIDGTLEVELNSYAFAGSTCVGQGGYSDQRAGSEVSVIDAKGKTVGTGSLSGGEVDYYGRTCIFSFKVNDIPKSSKYSIKIGTRIGPDYTYSELENQDWEVTLTLGS